MEECSSRNKAAARHQDITHFLKTIVSSFLLTVGTQQQLHSKHWQHTCSRGKDDHRVCKIPVFLSWIPTFFFFKFSGFSAGKFSRTAQTCSKTLQINNKSPLIHVLGQQNCTFVSHHVNQHVLWKQEPSAAVTVRRSAAMQEKKKKCSVSSCILFSPLLASLPHFPYESVLLQQLRVHFAMLNN